MKVIIWTTDEDGNKEKAGTIYLNDGKVVQKIVPGNERVMRMVWSEPVLTSAGDEIDREQDSEKWLKALPLNYMGHRLSAEPVE
jgi:hypothetical protein